MIQFKNVSKTYPNGTQALKNVSLQVDDGEFVFIVGSSGAGKSTFLKMIMCEEQADEGEIIVNGTNLSRMRKKKIPYLRRSMGIVFQDFRLIQHMTVYENVAFAQRVIGVSTRRIKESVPAMLQMVGLSAKYKMFPQQLSGGEQQRVAIARALINRPEVLLADEPTGNLDSQNADEIMRLLEEINRMGTTVVVVTHSEEIVARMHKRVITMERGCVISDEIRGGESDEN